MNFKLVIVGLLIGSVSLVTACDKGTPSGGGQTSTKQAASSGSGRCPHDIKQEKCPFCNTKLVESEGFCGEHGVAEALCFQCRPYLKAAFRAKGDWCTKHDAPDSQCVACHPELKDKMKPGTGHGVAAAAANGTVNSAAAGTCEHTIAKVKCPFCTPSLIESDGFCKEHNVAKALCVKCRTYLEAAFKAKGDWCKEHNAPKSHCTACNPPLKGKSKSQG